MNSGGRLVAGLALAAFLHAGLSGCASSGGETIDLFVALPEDWPPPVHATVEDDADRKEQDPDLPTRLWAAELTVATISENHTHSTLRGHFDAANGDAGGEIYELTLARTIGTMHLPVFGYEFHPRWEVPFTLGIVDESGSSAFLTYSLAIALRWVDWPWHDYLRTSASMGVGLIYTTNTLQIDDERNDDQRAPLKIHWPIQFTAALPRWPHYQLVGFSDHSSGGTLWDSGGFDNYGWGIRIEF